MCIPWSRLPFWRALLAVRSTFFPANTSFACSSRFGKMTFFQVKVAPSHGVHTAKRGGKKRDRHNELSASPHTLYLQHVFRFFLIIQPALWMIVSLPLVVLPMLTQLSFHIAGTGSRRPSSAYLQQRVAFRACVIACMCVHYRTQGARIVCIATLPARFSFNLEKQSSSHSWGKKHHGGILDQLS